MSRAETQGGARGNFPVEILLRSWQPTFTRFLAAREVNGAGKTLQSPASPASFTKWITSSTDTFGRNESVGHVWPTSKPVSRRRPLLISIALSWLGSKSLLCDAPSTESCQLVGQGRGDDRFRSIRRVIAACVTVHGILKVLSPALEPPQRRMRRILRGRIKQAAAMNARRTRYCVSHL